MLAFLLSRSITAKLATAVFIAAQILGLITYARAGEPAESAAPTPTSLPVVQRALREFDRFLDHHPLLENQLRLDAQLTASRGFLRMHPELREFLRANPNVGEGLKVYPRYFLNRALLRQASAPLSFTELAPFKDLFREQPALERELTATPESIRDPAFLESHATLRDCLVRHPALARVFLPAAVPPKSE